MGVQGPPIFFNEGKKIIIFWGIKQRAKRAQKWFAPSQNFARGRGYTHCTSLILMFNCLYYNIVHCQATSTLYITRVVCSFNDVHVTHLKDIKIKNYKIKTSLVKPEGLKTRVNKTGFNRMFFLILVFSFSGKFVIRCYT